MGRERKEFSHESFGTIGASHVSGNARLFMSPHKHRHFVTVRITGASLVRDLSNDWVYGDREVFAEVNMSEAQWAHFVSSPNMGSGSPCTIEYYRDGALKRAEAPPESAASRETFSRELREDAAKILKGVNDALKWMRGALSSGKPVSKTELKEVATNLSISLANDVDGGLGFTLQQSEEWLDKMVESAKTEIEAHAMAGLKGIALAAIADSMPSETKDRLIRQIHDGAAFDGDRSGTNE